MESPIRWEEDLLVSAQPRPSSQSKMNSKYSSDTFDVDAALYIKGEGRTKSMFSFTKVNDLFTSKWKSSFEDVPTMCTTCASKYLYTDIRINYGKFILPYVVNIFHKLSYLFSGKEPCLNHSSTSMRFQNSGEEDNSDGMKTTTEWFPWIAVRFVLYICRSKTFYFLM